MISIQNYINGEFVGTNENIEDINPANGVIIAHIPKSTSNDIESAVAVSYTHLTLPTT